MTSDPKKSRNMKYAVVLETFKISNGTFSQASEYLDVFSKRRTSQSKMSVNKGILRLKMVGIAEIIEIE